MKWTHFHLKRQTFYKIVGWWTGVGSEVISDGEKNCVLFYKKKRDTWKTTCSPAKDSVSVTFQISEPLKVSPYHQEYVIYQGEDKTYWARPVDEFEDNLRFIKVEDMLRQLWSLR